MSKNNYRNSFTALNNNTLKTKDSRAMPFIYQKNYYKCKGKIRHFQTSKFSKSFSPMHYFLGSYCNTVCQNKGVNQEKGSQKIQERDNSLQERKRKILRTADILPVWKATSSDWGRSEGPQAHFFKQMILTEYPMCLNMPRRDFLYYSDNQILCRNLNESIHTRISQHEKIWKIKR